jgi:hypothetical protein
MTPRAEAGAPSVEVNRLGSRAVGISWPTSAKRLALPMPATPGPNHRASTSAASVVATRATLCARPSSTWWSSQRHGAAAGQRQIRANLALSAHERQSHVRQADQRLAEILDRVGQHSAVLLVLCQDEQTGQTVAARASERGAQSWHMSQAEFLGALDRLGDNYDWVRPVVAAFATRPPRGE